MKQTVAEEKVREQKHLGWRVVELSSKKKLASRRPDVHQLTKSTAHRGRVSILRHAIATRQHRRFDRGVMTAKNEIKHRAAFVLHAERYTLPVPSTIAVTKP